MLLSKDAEDKLKLEKWEKEQLKKDPKYIINIMI